MSALPNKASQDLQAIAAEYIQHGWGIVPLPLGQKGPRLKDWQKRTFTVGHFSHGGGIGLIHGQSGTVAVDIDDLHGATDWLAGFGVDLEALLADEDTVQILSGKPGRGKLLYRLPEGLTLERKTYTVAGQHVIDFRAGAGIQDVLPPSIHPDTGKPYTWRGNWQQLPEIPTQLLAAWQSLEKRESRQTGATLPAYAPAPLPLPASRAEELRSALACIPADDRDLWVRMGMALHELGEVGRGLWEDWSRKSDKYQAADAAKVWRSFRPGQMHVESVFFEAQQHGWRTPVKSRQPAISTDNETARTLAAVERMQKSGVTEVTGVQASNDADSAVTPDSNPEVTGVTDSTSRVPGIEGRPVFLVFEEWTESEGRRYRPGVWYFGIKDGKGDTPPVLTQQWICSPLYVKAITFDGQDNNFGRLLRFKNSLGRWREWAMPMDMLRGSGEELRGELLAMGVEIDPMGKNLLANYLQARVPKQRMRCALQVGWCGKAFVLPDTVIGPDAGDVIFQSGERGQDEHTRAGTLAGWQTGIAAMAVGNPLLMLGIAASFAGPLLARCHAESGGIHFAGESSTGKSTIVEAACATWGGPNFKRSWRATANGIEGAAVLFNDSLLALDEIGECDPREVGNIVYALGNGRGKQRASRTGAARAVARWRCFVLSSGELTLGAYMAEGGHRVKAGQAVRLLDVPAARQYGAWDHLHVAATGEDLANALKLTAATHYGHAGRLFLERLTHDERDFGNLLERVKALPALAIQGGEGQHKRAAARFALAALAGEIATEYGITGWPEGAAIEAAKECFTAWRSLRGRGNDERRQIVQQLSGFIERHGDARFSDADDKGESPVRDRAGWWRNSLTGREYLFTTEGMHEALKGFDFNHALNTLQALGVIPMPGADGKRAKAMRIGGRAPMKLYTVDADKLGDAHGA